MLCAVRVFRLTFTASRAGKHAQLQRIRTTKVILSEGVYVHDCVCAMPDSGVLPSELFCGLALVSHRHLLCEVKHRWCV
jgi:hypothetical protein